MTGQVGPVAVGGRVACDLSTSDTSGCELEGAFGRTTASFGSEPTLEVPVAGPVKAGVQLHVREAITAALGPVFLWAMDGLSVLAGVPGSISP